MVCKICNKEIKDLFNLSFHIKKFHKNYTLSDYYDKFLNTEDLYCPICGKKKKFKSLSKGYTKTCTDNKCNQELRIKNTKKTCLEKYGVEFISQSKEFQDKIKNNCKNKYGVTHHLKRKSVIEKREKTNLKKYGCKNVFENKEIQEKSKESLIEKYGFDNISKVENIKEKKKETLKNNYNVEYPGQLQNKIQESNINKYGVPFYSQTDEYKEIVKETNLKKYGYENPAQSEEIKEKIRNTCLKKYGVDTVFKVSKIRNTGKEAILKKYGVPYYFLSNDHKIKIKKKYYKYQISILKKIGGLDKVIPLFSEEDYENESFFYQWKCKQCGNIFEDNLLNDKIPRCLNCYPYKSVSIQEKEIVEWLNSLNIKVEENNRRLIYPYEIDIYLPEYNIGIEYNGIYWHSELQGKNRNYHLKKWKKCKDNNINLINIYSDEWFNQKEIVKSIIKAKINKNDYIIYGRKCIIKEISNKKANDFYLLNHIQGSINSKINIGLFYNNKLVSVLSFSKSRFNKNYEYEITRFCNKINHKIIGSFAKLFKYFINNYNPKSIITYSDLRYFNGNIYKNNKFNLIKLSKPNYYYTDYKNRFNRLMFQKHKLKEILETFDNKLSEWENMQNNGFDRIWDCGNSVFEYLL